MKAHYEGNSKKPGIYKIVNTANGRIYIGSTKSFIQRIRQHLKSLKDGTHHNKFLQRDYEKCGEDAFEFHIIEVLENTDQAARLLIEQKYVDQFFDQQTNCYNLRSKTEGKPKGKNKGQRNPLSKETKLVIGEASKTYWKNLSQEEKERLANLRKELTKKQWANKEHRQKINEAQKANSYKLSKIKKEKALDLIVRQELNDRLDKAREKLIKTVTLVSPAGEIVEITNLYKWCRENGYNHEGMRSILRGKAKTYKKWRAYQSISS